MKNAVEISRLSFGYEKNKPVLKDISVSIESSAITVLLGKNGCGKSTLIDCMIGYHPVNDGRIVVEGQSIRELSDRQIARIIAYVPQNTASFVDFSVREFVSFGRNCYLGSAQRLERRDIEMAEESARKCGIEHLLDQSINKLSGGERQLAYFARALTQDTPIIIMDEPLSSLDLSNQQRALKMIKEISATGKTIILSTHNPNHALFLESKVVLISDGSIIETGNANDVVTVEKMKMIYGDEICLSNELSYNEISFTEIS